MAKMRDLSVLAIGAALALAAGGRSAAAELVSGGDAFITNVDGAPTHARSVRIQPGIHGVAFEYRYHEAWASCLFYFRIPDDGAYRIQTEIQSPEYVRIRLLAPDGARQVLWASSRPGQKLTPARALDVRLDSIDRQVILVDARMLPEHN